MILLFKKNKKSLDQITDWIYSLSRTKRKYRIIETDEHYKLVID